MHVFWRICLEEPRFCPSELFIHKPTKSSRQFLKVAQNSWQSAFSLAIFKVVQCTIVQIVHTSWQSGPGRTRIFP